MGKEFFKKWGLFSFVLLLSILIVSGCGNKDEGTSETDKDNDTAVTEEQNQTGEQFPVTFKDDADREITIEEEPTAIVSIQASITENLFALGAGDKIVGVSDYDNYPEEALEITKVGGQDFNVELILSLLPDIVFVTDYHHRSHPDILKQLEEAGIAVVVVGSASSFDDAYSHMEMIAKATGTTEKADEIIADMKERHEAIKEKAASITEKKRVLVEVAPAPNIYTTGKNTFMHEMLESIQAVNVAEDHEEWVKLNEEELVQLSPDVIITTYSLQIGEDPTPLVLGREGWAEVPAIKNKEVYDVPVDLVTRPGPRLIEGVEELAELIYPETFKE